MLRRLHAYQKYRSLLTAKLHRRCHHYSRRAREEAMSASTERLTLHCFDIGQYWRSRLCLKFYGQKIMFFAPEANSVCTQRETFFALNVCHLRVKKNTSLLKLGSYLPRWIDCNRTQELRSKAISSAAVLLAADRHVVRTSPSENVCASRS